MFEYIKGTLAKKDPHFAVIDVQGVGYLVSISVGTYSSLPNVDQTVTLYTSFIVREDSQTLYGFLSRGEKTLFEKVIGVSGIGPKTGLAMIGHLGIVSLQEAIFANNVALISKVPGIGKKTAQRLIIELKDKMEKSPETFVAGESHLLSDAVQALTNLGYHPMHAQRAVQSVMTKDLQDLGKIITAALQVI